MRLIFQLKEKTKSAHSPLAIDERISNKVPLGVLFVFSLWSIASPAVFSEKEAKSFQVERVLAAKAALEKTQVTGDRFAVVGVLFFWVKGGQRLKDMMGQISSIRAVDSGEKHLASKSKWT